MTKGMLRRRRRVSALAVRVLEYADPAQAARLARRRNRKVRPTATQRFTVW